MGDAAVSAAAVATDEEGADVPPPSSFAPPDTLVFSGGGPDGLAFVGCLRALERRAGALARVRTLVGCSAGAIVALFAAVGMTSDDIERWAAEGFEDRSLCDVDLDGILLAVDRLGLDDGERAMASVRRAVAARLAEVAPRLCKTSAGAAAGDPTFVELSKATGRDLVICVSNLEDGRRELLSVDTSPDFGVAAAVRASISIPLLFTPVRASVRAGAPPRTYVDGGLFDFCPVSHILASGSATSTLAFRIACPTPPAIASTTEEEEEEEEGASTSALSLSSYGLLLARALIMRTEQAPAGDDRRGSVTRVRTVDVPSLMLGASPPVSFDLASMSLAVAPEALQAYVRVGVASADEFFASFRGGT